MKLLTWSKLSVAIFVACISIVGNAGELLTVPEKTDYTQTSTLDDVQSFFSALQQRHPEKVILSSIGETLEGRPIPLVVLGNPAIAAPARNDKPVILLVGNIHAGEVEGKEALQMLARDILSRPSSPCLDHFTILMVPVFNADGNERIDPRHRSYQRVEKGVGIRTNALNMDLNRDFVKLENPETRALVRLFDKWQPLVYVDCHTTNGSYHEEPLTWTWGSNPNGSREMHLYIYNHLFPDTNDRILENHKVDAIPYGNFDDPIQPTLWDTFSSRLVYGVGYFAVKGSFSILNENYAYADFPTRTRACYALMEELIAYTLAHKDDMVRMRTAYLEQPDVRFIAEPEARTFSDPITIKGYVMKRNENGWARPTEERRDYTVAWRGDYAGESRTITGAYLLPPFLQPILERLHAHGIHLYRLSSPVEVPVRVFGITDIMYETRPFQGHFMMETVSGTYRTETRKIPEGWYVVPLNRTQPYRQLASVLLEAESGDALYRYGYISTTLYPSQWRRKTGDYPILHTEQISGLPMELVHDIP